MTSDYDNLKEDIQEIKTTPEAILKVLNGNGSDGLVTRVALNKADIKRVWWWLGGVSVSILTAAFFIIRGSFP